MVGRGGSLALADDVAIGGLMEVSKFLDWWHFGSGG